VGREWIGPSQYSVCVCKLVFLFDSAAGATHDAIVYVVGDADSSTSSAEAPAKHAVFGVHHVDGHFWQGKSRISR